MAGGHHDQGGGGHDQGEEGGDLDQGQEGGVHDPLFNYAVNIFIKHLQWFNFLRRHASIV